jgi:hypothetical protein
MTKRKRKTLFYMSTAIFLLAAGPILVYSFGYKLTWNNWQLQPTGGLFIAARPLGAKIFVDGVLQQQTSFINSSIFIPSLTPREYTIQIEKDGYTPWKKTLTVAPQIVTEIHATLISQTVTPTILATNLSNTFFSSPDGIQVIRELGSTGTSTLRFFDASTNTFLSPATSATRTFVENVNSIPEAFDWASNASTGIGQFNGDWIRFAFAPNDTLQSDSLYVKSGLKEALKKTPEIILERPNDPTKLYVLESKNLYIWDTQKKSLDPILDSVAAITADQNRLYILDTGQGYLYETDLDTKNPKQLTKNKLLNVTKATITKHDNYFIIRTPTQVYLADSASGTLEVINDKPAQVVFEDKDKNLLWWDSNNVWIHWLAPVEDWPHYQIRQQEKLFTSTEKIHGVYYYPRQDYAIIAAGTHVYIVEFDGRENQRNVATFYTGTNPQIFVTGSSKTMFILDQGHLMKFTLE